MSRKRREARLAAAEGRARAAAEEQVAAEERVAVEELAAAKERAAKEQAAKEQLQDVMAGLRNLGCRANEARRAAEFSGTLQDVTLEERMRAALKFLSRGSMQIGGSAEVSHAR